LLTSGDHQRSADASDNSLLLAAGALPGLTNGSYAGCIVNGFLHYCFRFLSRLTSQD
jgi:hypothetical protein